MGNVATLDAPGHDRQPQALLKIAQSLLHVVGAALLLGERVPRVVVRHREELDAVTALRKEQDDLVPGAVRQPLGDAVDAFGLARQDYLVGHERRDRLVVAVVPGPGERRRERRAVVLRQEGRDDLFVGDLRLLDRVGHDVCQLAGSHVQQRDLDQLAFPVKPEDVAVHVVDGDHALLFAHLLDRAQLVTVNGGELEPHVARGLPHLFDELARELVVAALEELADGVDLLAIPAPIDGEHAGRRTALDLVLQARPPPARELDVAARAELEILVHEVQRPPRRRR